MECLVMAANPLTFALLGNNLLALLVKTQPPFNVTDFVGGVDAFFAQLYPEAIRYAEARIYGELVLLGQRTTDSSLLTVPSSRVLNLALMTKQIIVPEGLALITPAGTTSPSQGTRVPFDMASLDVIDLMWPTESVTQTPSITDFTTRMWALREDSFIVIAPTPDAAYTVTITGLFQPSPLSATTTTTYLSTIYPALLEAACMVFLCGGILKNFGAKSDNPAQALSWEAEVMKLMALAKDEEHRRRGLKPNIATPNAPPGRPAP